MQPHIMAHYNKTSSWECGTGDALETSLLMDIFKPATNSKGGRGFCH